MFFTWWTHHYKNSSWNYPTALKLYENDRDWSILFSPSICETAWAGWGTYLTDIPSLAQVEPQGNMLLSTLNIRYDVSCSDVFLSCRDAQGSMYTSDGAGLQHRRAPSGRATMPGARWTRTGFIRKGTCKGGHPRWESRYRTWLMSIS